MTCCLKTKAHIAEQRVINKQRCELPQNALYCDHCACRSSRYVNTACANISIDLDQAPNSWHTTSPAIKRPQLIFDGLQNSQCYEGDDDDACVAFFHVSISANWIYFFFLPLIRSLLLLLFPYSYGCAVMQSLFFWNSMICQILSSEIYLLLNAEVSWIYLHDGLKMMTGVSRHLFSSDVV